MPLGMSLCRREFIARFSYPTDQGGSKDVWQAHPWTHFDPGAGHGLTACGAPATQQPAAPQATEAPAQEAAAPQEPAATEPLKVWITWGDNPAQLQSLFDQYGAANNVKIEVTAPIDEEKILPALTSSSPPDILILDGGDLVKSYAAEGLVVELSDAIKTGGIEVSDIFPAPLGQCAQAGK